MSSPTSLREQAPVEDYTRWFSEEVKPHEGQLRAYLRRKYPSLRDVDDLVQESYLRLWRARGTAHIRSTKNYLFSVARNTALAVFRRKSWSREVGLSDGEWLGFLDDVNVAETANLQQECELVMAAIDGLPGRCREIMILSVLQRLPNAEIAARLAISEHTVRGQMAKGLRRCGDYLRKHGVASERH